MDLDQVASRKLVEQLWDDVRRREATLAPLPEVTAATLSLSLPLRYLNLNWRSDPVADPFKGMRTPRHRVASRFARLVAHVLAPTLARDEEFRAYVVRVANASAEAHDDLLREVRLLRAAIEDRTVRMTERTDTLARQFDERLDPLEHNPAP